MQDYQPLPMLHMQDPEPDPQRRRYMFSVNIPTGRKLLPGDPGFPYGTEAVRIRPKRQGPRRCRTREIIEQLLARGVTDPYDLAAAAGVGVSAARHWLDVLEEGKAGA